MDTPPPSSSSSCLHVSAASNLLQHHSYCSTCYSSTSSLSSSWISSIQNQSYQPKPTAYSPSSPGDEDPLIQQQHQCLDKLCALRKVRDWMQFYPVQNQNQIHRNSVCHGMNISTKMILSGADETMEWQKDGDFDPNARHSIGIDALGSLEMLSFEYFTRQELLCCSSVCTAWRTLARDDFFWEPFLFTSLEKYPMRSLLGLERSILCPQNTVPAILVYMVYHKLQLAHAAYPVKDSNKSATRVNFDTRTYNGSVDDLMQTQNRQRQAIIRQQIRIKCQEREDDVVTSVHLVGVKVNVIPSPLQMQQDHEVTPMAAELRLQTRRQDQGALFTGMLNEDAIVFDEQQRAALNVQNDAGDVDDEDIYSVADGLNRVTLSAWLSTKKRVDERTLRSFLRQLLLAVNALERSHCEHTDISPVNVVVHCQQRDETTTSLNASTFVKVQTERDDSEEKGHGGHGASVYKPADVGSRGKILQDNYEYSRRHTPLFQLFVSRRNCQQTSGAQERALDSMLAMNAANNANERNNDNLHGIAQERHTLAGNDLREVAQERQRPAEAELEVTPAAGVFVNGGNHNAMTATFRNQLTRSHPSMVSSVIQTAMTVWSRGRFADANASSVLTQLLRFPDSFSSSLRSFLEYAKYLVITRLATAMKLLRHNYLRCPETCLDLHSSPHWSTTQISDVNEYKNKLILFYGSLPPFCVDGLLDENAGASVQETVMDELMPRTNLGRLYFSKALQEADLSSKRFISVVAPSTASSSWVRRLARTQCCTLQRLDLSHAHVPMSVLLQELATLPRLTHLRLPKQILRDENMEHFVAALAYTNLLPHLRGLDQDMRQTMDRMEQSYRMQLDMVTFLLQKPSASNLTAGAGANA